jgi:hypothetical protein
MMTPEQIEAMLDINAFRAWLSQKRDEHVGQTVSTLADPIGCFFCFKYKLAVLVEDKGICLLGYSITIPHKPWSRKFVSLLRNEYAGHDWVRGSDALHILEQSEKE